jgi:RNA recognition motif-containing protein
VIVKNKRTQKPRGFGFVTYSDIRSVSKVIGMRNNHYIDGKWIDCKSAIPVEEIKYLEMQHSQFREEEAEYAASIKLLS